MYTCPECGEHNVRIFRTITISESWYGDDFEVEEDTMTNYLNPGIISISCLDCGCEGDACDIEKWTDEP